MPTSVAVACYNFRGHPVRRLTFRDEIAFVAREVGAALGYEEGGKRFASKVTGDWSNELKEGFHWHRVKGEELRLLKAALRLGTGPVPTRPGADSVPSGAPRAGLGAAPVPSDALARVPEVILLTEQGLNLALMRSGQPIAAEFRNWLASEVVPQIARTGRYDPLARLRAVRPSRDTLALIRIVSAAMAAGRLDVAADLIDAGRRLAAAPGERLLPPPARLRASNRLLVRLIQRGALKGPRLAQLLQQPAWRPSEKAVLGLLLDLGGEELRVELSYRDLAERIDVSRRTVIGAIRVFGNAGVVTCTQGRGGRDPEPNVYVVDPEALAAWNDKERPDTWSEAEKGPPR